MMKCVCRLIFDRFGVFDLHRVIISLVTLLGCLFGRFFRKIDSSKFLGHGRFIMLNKSTGLLGPRLFWYIGYNLDGLAHQIHGASELFKILPLLLRPL